MSSLNKSRVLLVAMLLVLAWNINWAFVAVSKDFVITTTETMIFAFVCGLNTFMIGIYMGFVRHRELANKQQIINHKNDDLNALLVAAMKKPAHNTVAQTGNHCNKIHK